MVVKNEVLRDHAFTISGGLANGGNVARIGGAVVADKPTKRRESALLAGTNRGATWLGSEGKTFPPPKKKIIY